VNTKKQVYQRWPFGLHESWAGRKPLDCEVVQAHVLLREKGGVWIQGGDDEGARLLGRIMAPAERPAEVVSSVLGRCRNLPEIRQRWVNSVRRCPKALRWGSVCHLFIEVDVNGLLAEPHFHWILVGDDCLQQRLSEEHSCFLRLISEDEPVAA
jgi:hypothetical protein